MNVEERAKRNGPNDKENAHVPILYSTSRGRRIYAS
jgi:hypothetical protein